MKYKGAAIQYDCHFMDKEITLAALTSLVRQAAAQGAKLIVQPEKCATDTILKVWNNRPRWQSPK